MTLQQELNELHRSVTELMSWTEEEVRVAWSLSDDEDAHKVVSNRIMGYADDYSKRLGGKNYNWSYNEVMDWIKTHCLVVVPERHPGKLL